VWANAYKILFRKYNGKRSVGEPDENGIIEKLLRTEFTYVKLLFWPFLRSHMKKIQRFGSWIPLPPSGKKKDRETFLLGP
jgi:hypothetical protein